jgi:hypothetical protein
MAEGGGPSELQDHGTVHASSAHRAADDVPTIRSIFGAATRAEILRCLLYNIEFDRISVQMLADETNYGKRIVAESAESLAHAGNPSSAPPQAIGMCTSLRIGKLQRFIGAQPKCAPEWNDLLLIVGTLLEISDRWDESSAEVLRVEIRRALRRIEAALDRHGIAGPDERTGVQAIADWDDWAGALITELAAGVWPGEAVR